MKAIVLAVGMLVSSHAQAASWDMLAGGVPGHDSLVTVDLGFAALPRVAYQYGITNRFSIGGSFVFDYADLSSLPRAVFSPAIAIGLPMRIEAYRGGRLSFGIKLEPGLALGFAGATHFGMILSSGFNLGYWVVDKFMVGGGIDLPITVYFAPAVTAIIPILFGPILEFHATNVVALGFDLKIGPGIHTGGAVDFAMRLLFTIGFHF